MADNSVQKWPDDNAQLTGTTTVSLTLTGQLVGFVLNSATSFFYVKSRYLPTISPLPIPKMSYTLGSPTLTQTVNVVWPATPTPAPSSIYVNLDDVSLV